MTVVDWFFVGLAVGSIVLFGWIISRGHDERHDEDAARAHFDRHGHFPDEDPDEVAALIAREREGGGTGYRDSNPGDYIKRDDDQRPV